MGSSAQMEELGFSDNVNGTFVALGKKQKECVGQSCLCYIIEYFFHFMQVI